MRGIHSQTLVNHVWSAETDGKVLLKVGVVYTGYTGTRINYKSAWISEVLNANLSQIVHTYDDLSS
jgi:hypothetical protein